MPKYRNPKYYMSYNWDANLQRVRSSTAGDYYSYPRIFNLRNNRSGTGYYWNEHGLLQESMPDENRFDWNPMPDGSIPNMPDILLEEESTNLANDRFANSGTTAWIRTSFFSTNSTSESPSGRRNGMQGIVSVATTTPVTNQFISRDFAVATNTKTWFSFYVKPVSWDFFGVDIIDTSGTLKNILVDYDTTLKTATQTSSESHFIEAEIQPCPNNWYRLILGFNTSTISTVKIRVGYRMRSSVDALGFESYNQRAFFWGFQLENVNLNHETTVIWNNTTGTLTRAQDLVTSTTLVDMRGYTAGVIGLRYKLFDSHTQTFNRTIGFGHLASNNFIGVKVQTDNRPFGQIQVNGVTEMFKQPTVAEAGNPKQWTNVVIGHQLNRAQMWVNGVRIGAIDTQCALFTSGDYPQTILLDSGGTATRFFGRIQFVRAWVTLTGGKIYVDEAVDKLCYEISNNPNKINPWTK